MISRIRTRSDFRSPSNTERLQAFRSIYTPELSNSHFRFTRAATSETGNASPGERRPPHLSGGIFHDPTDHEEVREAARFEFGDIF